MANESQFSGKVVLVTGGGSGIGEACAKEFAARGANVVVADLHQDAAQRVAGEIGGMATAVTVDVADPASVDDMVKAAIASHGGLNVAVNNAGSAGS